MAEWEAESSSRRGSTSQVADEDDDDTVYVAVGKDFEENKLNLVWAIENFPGKRLCIIHVHQPAKMIPFVGGKFPASRLAQHELKEFQKLERNIMLKILDDYVLFCGQLDVHADKLCVEMDDVGKGIIELAYHYDIKKLVMGAAANKHYSEEMMDLKSKKAKYIQLHVPSSCQIWYICNGYFICKRDSTCSTTNGFGNSASFLQQRTDGSGLELELHEVSLSEENSHNRDSLEESSIDQLYNQLERAMSEAEKFKKQALEESLRCGVAEKTAVNAVRRAKDLEILYARELRCRKEIEGALAREKENHQRTKNQWDEERVITKDQKLLQHIQVSKFDEKIKELNDERLSAVEQCKEYKKERDKLQVEHDNVLKLAKELAEELSKKQVEDASCSQMHQFLSVFSLSEIHEATFNFDPILRIGRDGYGNTYRANLRHTPVAIKVLNPESMQGRLEFEQEVELLSKLRHPNLAILIGACSEACALVYEYLPNGTLEDRLSCKDNTPPLPWQARIRIATELCSVLMFLHSSKPHSIVHGGLKPGNILLDANLACKLSDFGFCRALSLCENPRGMILSHETDPTGTFLYLDPHFLATGELSPNSDTYSFGIILLQLLTGRSAFSIASEVRDVIDERNLSSFLDPQGGDWPFVQAKQLAQLALSCCARYQSSRPDLASEVWRVLEPMRTFSSPLVQFGSQEGEQPPSYFFCPILQEVMQDPHVAADGFTYEAEALTGWLESGHNTSPMTNLVLDNLNLVPNRSLRSAIQDWQQQHPNAIF
ncbi:hypothetical protein P3X46_014767 [Hevea brasiliensis]|uniref:RING-type E3 ubiquitin transferase n=1 Tax=Hevea brasiliensis TaxID=3981 RepID=A0ABQ9LV50_HEVBR|nr:U-box domain-containing protein 33 [Hevea brasiliensis]KAJ9171390.1 hypothetical protein P3X46_014767 [Hevea brasiliensis]